MAPSITDDMGETGTARGWRRFAGAVNGADTRLGYNARIDVELAAEYDNRSPTES